MFRISFYAQGSVYELYAKEVLQSELYGFVELSELVFGATTGLVVDPAEERLKNEFGGVKSTLIPTHAILRIDVVEKVGVAKILEGTKTGSSIVNFPGSYYSSPKPSTDG